jgi:RimJ/RimL family protein N-acetyltransferase
MKASAMVVLRVGGIVSEQEDESMLPIRTARLALRDFVEADWHDVHEYASDPEVVRDMIWGPNSEEQTREFVARTLEQQGKRPRLQYGLVIEFEGKVVGAVRIDVQNESKREADLGYVVHQKFWRRGIATEAARALLKFGFGQLKLHRLWATCDPSNAGSIRVLEKIGMQREGRLREHQFIKGRWRDSLLFAMLDHDWSATA